MTTQTRPRLRALDFQPVFHRGERMWFLRDPWQMSERQIILPQTLAQMLLLCDGTRTVQEIHATLCNQLGGEVPYQAIVDALVELDRSYLLQNAGFEAERQRHLIDFRKQPYRPPALAGLSYPDSPGELTALFKEYGNGLFLQTNEPWRGKAVVSPHIDYQRGGSVYAQVWQRATPAVLQADLVLIFGTDHNGSPGSITLTRQPYATPYGVLPTDQAIIDRLAAVLGSEVAFAEELNHRNEHSVELSAVWLHHVFEQTGHAPVPMIPILVGSFHHFLSDGAHPAQDVTYQRFLTALHLETEGRRVLAVASVDLAHVGPAFGDPFDMDVGRRASLRQQDRELIATIIKGDARDFYCQIASVKDRNRICGFAPIYLMLEYLRSTGGTQVAYEHCPADPANTSLVSICGLLLD